MSADEQSSSQHTIQSVGAELATLRQAQNMSVNDVAYRLKLTPKQITAIEQDDFASLGPIFSRGFVRNYARLLQQDPQPFLDAMQAAPANPVEALTIHDEQIALTGNLSRHWLKLSLLALLIVIALPLAVYQWLRVGDAPKATSPSHSIVSRTPPPVPKIAPTPAPAAPAVEPPTPVQPAPPVSLATPPAAPATQAEGSGHIQINFKQDAWVQITDASKRRLTSRIYRAGETAQLTGEAPFSAIIGNAANVSMTYNGKPVTLTPRPGTTVAHLTIE